MNIHRNARTTPYSRAEIVRRVMVLHETPRAVATALGVSQRTVAKWLARYRAEGEAGLADRSSRPHAMPSATPADRVEQVIALRRQRITGKQIAKTIGLSAATVSRVLRKARLSRMRERHSLRLALPSFRYILSSSNRNPAAQTGNSDRLWSLLGQLAFRRSARFIP